VLWSVINPLWEGLREMGFKGALLDPAIATNDDQIKNKLAEWHEYLEPGQIWQEYQQALAIATQKNADEQLMYCVHGKFFFAQIGTPVLNQHFIQASADKHQQEIFKTLPIPADLDPLWQKMGLKP
jgi:hypothetical protein